MYPRDGRCRVQRIWPVIIRSSIDRIEKRGASVEMDIKRHKSIND